MSNHFGVASSNSQLTDGSADINVNTIRATNLSNSSAIRTSGTGLLTTSNLVIADVTGLQASLDANVPVFGRATTLITPKTSGDTLGVDNIQSEAGSADITMDNIVDASAGLKIATGTAITAFIDDDSMGTASGTNIASAESIVAYVTASVAVEDHWDRTGNNLTPATASGILNIDNIIEESSGVGCTIEGILIKDSIVATDTINEGSADSGVTIDGVLVKDNIISGVVGMDFAMTSDDQLLIETSADPRTITTGTIRVNQTSGINSTRALHVEADPAGFEDVRSITTNLNLNGSSATINIAGMVSTADITGATNAHVEFFRASSSGVVGSGMELHGYVCEPNIDCIEHRSGVFGDVDFGWVWSTGFTDRTTEFNSGASDIQLFVANSDYIAIGNSTTFTHIDFDLAIVASNPGIMPTFEYSDGVGSFATLSVTDDTNGLRNNGQIAWSIPAGWTSEALNAETYYWIKITRASAGLVTPPTENLIQLSTPTTYFWDTLGNVNVNSVQTENITSSTGHTIDMDSASVVDITIADSGSLRLNGAVATGDSVFKLNRSAIGDQTKMKYCTATVDDWEIKMDASSTDLEIYNTDATATSMTFENTGNHVNITNTLKVDTIAESNADTGVTLDGVLVKDGGVTLGTGIAVNAIYDTDGLTEDSAVGLASQQSIKAYVDAQIVGSGLWTRVTNDIAPLTASGILNIDNIIEESSGVGCTIEGILIKDSIISTDTISEKTGSVGVTIDSVLCLDGAIQLDGPTAAIPIIVRGNSLGDAKIQLLKDASADSALLLFKVASTDLFSMGSDGDNNMTIHNMNSTNQLMHFGVSSDDITFGSNTTLFAPLLYGNVVNDRPLHIEVTTGEFGTVSSMTAHKKNIQSLTYDDAKWLYDIDPKLYNRRVLDKSSGGQIPTENIYPWIEPGMLAEDVAIHCEPLCYYADMGSRTTLQGYRDEKLSPYIIKILQSQKSLINALTTQNGLLQGRCTSLESRVSALEEA